MATPSFSPEERECLSNIQFFRTKRKVQQKLNKLLMQTHRQLVSAIPLAELPTTTDKGKISRGENYNGLPYLILDYPKHFTRDNSLAFRTLAWWGHDFCCSLLMFGHIWEERKEQVIQQLPSLAQHDCWLATGHSPWEHHPAAGNHKALTPTTTLEPFADKPFFKISRTLPLENPTQLAEFTRESWQLFSGLL